ncbi:MAG TPA: phosphoglucomutase/phosphomannomutase family protein, partial [Candidatus Atribacteria bacterium]|nr:phosphoglucomutase/phosphomannomutase family protein [Candidatus Atribacteria bacterium]
IEPSKEYIDTIKKYLNLDLIKSKNLKIIIDNMYGPGKGYIENILEDTDTQIIILHTEHNPLFGGIIPEPISENLQETKFMVMKEKADLGVVTDGDADRFGLIDRGGKYISHNEALALLLYHLYENKKLKGDIARSIATTHLLDRIAEYYGFKTFETPVGFKYIAEIMKNHDTILMGGEESGGFTLKEHILEKDGILADVLLIELYSYENKKSFSEMIEEIKQKFGYLYNKRFNIYISREKKGELMQYIKENNPSHSESKEPIKKEIINDGVRFTFPDESWTFIRPSGTEDIIRLYIEAKSEEDIGSIYEYMNNFLKTFKGGVK